jgi:hypothetical protein
MRGRPRRRSRGRRARQGLSRLLTPRHVAADGPGGELVTGGHGMRVLRARHPLEHGWQPDVLVPGGRPDPPEGISAAQPWPGRGRPCASWSRAYRRRAGHARPGAVPVPWKAGITVILAPRQRHSQSIGSGRQVRSGGARCGLPPPALPRGQQPLGTDLAAAPQPDSPPPDPALTGNATPSAASYPSVTYKSDAHPHAQDACDNVSAP